MSSKAKNAASRSRKGKVATKVIAKAPAAKRVLTATLAGGYRVFDTPVEPQHTTRERIAEAVAAFK